MNYHILKNWAIPIPPNCPSLVALCYQNKEGELIVRDMGCRLDETRIYGNEERNYLVHKSITGMHPVPKFIIKKNNELFFLKTPSENHIKTNQKKD